MFTVTYSCGRCCQTFTNPKDQSEHTYNCGKKKTETKPVEPVEPIEEEKLNETEEPEKKHRGRPKKQG